jgi:endonuclease/exonuclease/phosphatase family metal-dependent hydrolase
MQLRIITYNIHKGIGGVDRRYRPERIIMTLQRYNADIVFLQEVDDNVPRSRFHRQVDLIGDALSMHYRAFQSNVKLTRGHYGNAILSRYPLVDIENINLTISIKKRRRALVAHCQLQNDHQRTLLLINCHLGLAGFERIMQLRKILDSHVMKYVHHATPVIIGGDYNDVWGTLGKNVMFPASFMPVSKKINTFPAILPVRQLDQVYYRGDLVCKHSFPGHSDLARQASDHLPLIADFELKIF